ncbi:MAG TPA: hypothetical protein PKC60_07985 [Hydrogenophaga sp.]|uniref:hypothetical protein n=1 Tax=Hydrogenophaga sp. TaxID=1904254 RepID=UPI002BED1EF3|nr:hypothetical protein [Hydrogenophaga sp.]HMN93156.1 hypothetical protein [Hydrogenophaga sp.]HMP10157.1 hypothetical protein [Hydrogenophaga sp.]
MITDNPNTVSMEEPTRWAETLAEDVFHPGVSVRLHWRDVEAAVEQGAVLPQHAHALWASWAMPGSPTRLVDPVAPPPSATSSTLSDPPYLERLRQQRAQAAPPPERRRSSWFSHLMALVAGALLAFFGLAFL